MMISTQVMTPALAVLMLLAMENVGQAQDQADMRTSLQGCLNDALTSGNFDKARMGTRGTLVVHCSDQPARQMYINLSGKVPERAVTLRNGDKGTERKFGLSTCMAVREKTDAAEFSCRIAVSVGSELLEQF